MSTRLTLLGTGSSGGVPRLANDWGQCDPLHPRNRRRRCAMLVSKFSDPVGKATAPATRVLIDAGADMREQMLSAGVPGLDAVLLTHAHADHIFGLDDLRQFWVRDGRRIPVYQTDETREIVMRSFGYCFVQAAGSSYPAFCEAPVLQDGVPVAIEGDGGAIRLLPLAVEHGDIDALGFRIGDAAYIPDLKSVQRKNSRAALADLDLLIIDALRRREHPSHLNLAESLQMIEDLAPRRAVLTNMHSDLDYMTLKKTLPAGVIPGYDGMQLSVD